MPDTKYGFGNPYWGDNVPCDVPPPQDLTVEHICLECGNTWLAVMDFELGGYFYYDEDHDKFCPSCGCEGMIA